METLEEKVARVLREEVAVVPYDPRWTEMYERERRHLLSCLPADLVKRIEHFGSTAVPGLCAKPVVDMIVEVTSLEQTRQRIAPLLEAQGYDYFWRPSWGDDTPPFYAWFIKRDKYGKRTHHIHMVESWFEHWGRLMFRDYLIEHPDIALEYGNLKMRLAGAHQNDRVAYTQAKGEFIRQVTERAKRYYRKAQPRSQGRQQSVNRTRPVQGRDSITPTSCCCATRATSCPYHPRKRTLVWRCRREIVRVLVRVIVIEYAVSS